MLFTITLVLVCLASLVIIFGREQFWQFVSTLPLTVAGLAVLVIVVAFPVLFVLDYRNPDAGWHPYVLAYIAIGMAFALGAGMVGLIRALWRWFTSPATSSTSQFLALITGILMAGAAAYLSTTPHAWFLGFILLLCGLVGANMFHFDGTRRKEDQT